MEQAGRDIKHTLLRISLLGFYPNGIDEMRLSTAGRTEYEEWIKGRLTRMLTYGETHRAGQLVAVALDEVLERLLQVKLGIESLRHCSIEN